MRPWRNRQTRTFEGRVGNRAGSSPVGRTKRKEDRQDLSSLFCLLWFIYLLVGEMVFLIRAYIPDAARSKSSSSCISRYIRTPIIPYEKNSIIRYICSLLSGRDEGMLSNPKRSPFLIASSRVFSIFPRSLDSKTIWRNLWCISPASSIILMEVLRSAVSVHSKIMDSTFLLNINSKTSVRSEK